MEISGEYSMEWIKDGLFHCLSPKMKESLLRMAIRDALAVRANEEIVLNK